MLKALLTMMCPRCGCGKLALFAVYYIVILFLNDTTLGQVPIRNYRQCPGLAMQKTLDGFPVGSAEACFDTLGWEYCTRVNINRLSEQQVAAFCSRWPIGQAGCCFSCSQRNSVSALARYNDMSNCKNNIPDSACNGRFSAYCSPTNCNQVIYIYANCRATCHKANPAFGWCSPPRVRPVRVTAAAGMRTTASPGTAGTIATIAPYTGSTPTIVTPTEYTGSTPTAVTPTEYTGTSAGPLTSVTTAAPGAGPSLTGPQATRLKTTFDAIPPALRDAYTIAALQGTLSGQLQILIDRIGPIAAAAPGDTQLIAFDTALEDTTSPPVVDAGLRALLHPSVYRDTTTPPTAVNRVAALAALGITGPETLGNAVTAIMSA